MRHHLLLKFKAIEKMTKISGNKLPLSKVTVISAALAETDGSHSLGLIVIKSFLFEYPKFARTTTVIVKEVIEQWISSMLTVCDASDKNFSLQVSFFANFIKNIEFVKAEFR